jgi:polyferredoxin
VLLVTEEENSTVEYNITGILVYEILWQLKAKLLFWSCANRNPQGLRLMGKSQGLSLYSSIRSGVYKKRAWNMWSYR